MHATRDKDNIRELYELTDRVTQEVVDPINPDATLALLDHGMRPVSDYRFDKDMGIEHDTRQAIWGGQNHFDSSDTPL